MWLCERVQAYGLNKGAPDDPWWYKDEYNARLLRVVEKRKLALKEGKAVREDYLIAGSEQMLDAFRQAGMELFVASGTDHADVIREATLLRVEHYFSRIAGAPHRRRAVLERSGVAGLAANKRIRRRPVAGDGRWQGRDFAGAGNRGMDDRRCQR